MLIWLGRTSAGLTLAWLCLLAVLRASGGAELVALDAAGLVVERWRVAELSVPDQLPPAVVQLRWSAHLAVRGSRRVLLRGDGAASLWLDEQVVAALPASLDGRPVGLQLDLPSGQLVLTFDKQAHARRLRLSWLEGGETRTLGWRELSPHGSRVHALAALGAPMLGTLSVWAWGLLAAVLFVAALRARHGGLAWTGALTSWPRVQTTITAIERHPRVLWRVAVFALTGYAALLRFEALVGRYWVADPPAWAQQGAALAHAVRPGPGRWLPAAHPYDGDPWGYLRYARDGHGFYDAHVREPVFVFATRAWLPLVGGSDLAVNLASLMFSVLVVPALCLVGRARGSGLAGWLAGLLWTIEWTVIELSVEGWRDDAFALAVVLSLWALTRLRAHPTHGAATVLAAVAALACLTRITALSFLVPGAALLAIGRGPEPAARRRAVAWASLGALLLVGPYLWNCWRVYGDAFHSINAHTVFYRARAGLPALAPQGWLDYLLGSRPPLQRLELFLLGVTSYPFEGKWAGFENWAAWLGPWLAALAVLGLLRWLGGALGRLGLVVLLSACVPFAFTWDLPGGGERRFTLFAYALLLLAAAELAVAVTRRCDPLTLRRQPRLASLRRALVRAGAALGLVLLILGLLAVLRVAVVRETLMRTEPAQIGAGLQQQPFYGPGWSWPREQDGRLLRDSLGAGATLVLPLEDGAGYEVTLRLRRVGPSSVGERELSVREHGRELARGRLSSSPDWQALRAALAPRPPGQAVRLELVATDGAALDVQLWFFELQRRAPSGL